MGKVQSKRDRRSGAINGRILLVRLGSVGSKTHFGIETQRDHVKGSLLDALAAHDFSPVALDLPADAQLQLGERWELKATVGGHRSLLILCQVTRTWTARPVLRFEVQPQ